MTKKFTFELIDGLGLEVGGEMVMQKAVELKELTAGETFRAQDNAEEVTKTAEGFELIASPSKLSRELLRLSIVRIGHIDGVSMATLSKLTSRDLTLLMSKHDEFLGIRNALLNKRLESAKSLGKQS